MNMTNLDHAAGRGSGSAVLLGLSGGVDSAASAILLKEAGYRVRAVTLWTWTESSDRSLIEQAGRSAALLGIPHEVVDVRQAFYQEVVVPFVQAWQEGLTPNPCVFCNPDFKFKVMARLADQLDCQYLATGHYARLADRGQGPALHRALHREQDQSYFLYRLTPALLDRTLFPVGSLTKAEVRQIAERYRDPAAGQRDSQDICFIGKNQLKGFLSRQGLKDQPGPFLDRAGQIIGQHQGSWHFTPGQRRRLGQAFGRRMTVLSVDRQKNTVTLGDEEDALIRQLELTDLVFPRLAASELDAQVQLRSQGTSLAARLAIEPDGLRAKVFLDQAVRLTAAGQSAVFYDDDEVLGGGLVASMSS
ncbi:MAG: tRNA 2-thiouridine(34) synthase MnmA [Saccharofermentanales bacterium]